MYTLEVPVNLTWPSRGRRSPSGHLVWWPHLATKGPGSLPRVFCRGGFASPPGRGVEP
jgi:hypothetical protein